MEKIVYTVLWRDDDGTLLKKEEVIEGAIPDFGQVPSKADEVFIYIFDSWNIHVTEIYSDTEYIATYKKIVNNLILSDYYGNGFIVKGYKEKISKVIIPSKYLGKPILVIGSKAFSDCTSLIELEVLPGVFAIEQAAFKSCTSLKKVTLPYTLRCLEDSAFFNCISLENVIFPNNDSYSLLKLGMGYVFSSNPVWDDESVVSGSLAYGDIELSEGINKIHEEAFLGCSGIKSFTFPGSLKEIAPKAFFGCSGIRNINISSKNKNYYLFNLGNGKVLSKTKSWSNNSNAIVACGDIVFPSNISTIANHAFYGLSSITSITLPSNITKIGGNAFTGCNLLKKVVLPNSIQEIGGFCFASCSDLEEINIPKSVKKIDSYAFSGCDSLLQIVLPDTIEILGTAVFSSSVNLKIYCLGAHPNPGWNSYWNMQSGPIFWNYKRGTK
jgi:hypothetical protein